ncbi:MAG: PDZ domain-containing protein [Planctomycetes bacterium]|nr:PDZ domain-containing protein [Planctomycetota bacterium]
MRRPLSVLPIACAILATPLAAPLAAQSAADPGAAAAPAARVAEAPWSGAFDWQPLGPANMGGRIVDLAVAPSDPTVWYVATASGGLLKTTNGGVTFEHRFDREATVSLGAVAVAAQDPDVVWVGTGEENPRNSVSRGDGVYRSTDGGLHWEHRGLAASFQIGSIVIDPRDPDVVWVGALGRLYGPNAERGLYRTTDGGESWQQVLAVDERTGVIEIEMCPGDPDTLLVATWERQRDGFDTNDPATKWGPGAALYRTSDGGRRFERVTAGLPSVQLGRIGLDWSRSAPQVVYALIETERMGTIGDDVGEPGLTAADAETGARITRVSKDGAAAAAGLLVDDIVLAVGGTTVLGRRQLDEQLAVRGPGDTVELEIARGGESRVVALTLAERAKPESGEPERPFGTRLGGQVPNVQALQGREGFECGGLFRSDDGGLSWRRVNSIDPRPMYFSQVRVDPSDPQRVYVLGISLARSADGGESFTTDASRGVHSDHHAMWIDPSDGRHLLLGTDGGLYETRDRCENWHHHNHMALGQFYHVAVDASRDYRVFGGLQDNGTWGAPRRSPHGAGPVNEDWLRIGGGDGFVVQIDPEDRDQVYYESQFGGMARTHLATMAGGGIRPPAERGESHRFNWRTPFLLSHHNSRIFYCAGERVFRSLNRGEDLVAISPEITRTDRGSATALAESPRDARVLYVGTDDGALWVSRDAGQTWQARAGFAAEGSAVGESAAGASAPRPLAAWLPGPRWVSSIEASRVADGRVYVTLDGHRSDDDRAHVLVSEDFGATWASLADGLPHESTRVVREDLVNPDLLYLGTEVGLRVSLDRGGSWLALHGGELPTVAIHEVAQHPTAGEIVVATHGRSLWALDVTALRQLTAAALREPVHLFAPNDAVLWQRRHGRGVSGGASRFTGENPPGGAAIFFRLAEDAPGVELRVVDVTGATVRSLDAPATAGLHRVDWDLRVERDGAAEGPPRGRGRGRTAEPGSYRVVLRAAGQQQEQVLRVLADPTAPATAAPRDAEADGADADRARR